MIRKLTPEETPRANELFAIAFEQPMDRAAAQPDEEGFTRWAALDGEEMMSTLSVTDFMVHFDGHACQMGGIGGVATLPQYRRRGGIRGCFQAMLPDLYANGYDFSYLYPFSTAYYRKFGYECCVQKYHAAVDLALLTPPEGKGTLHLIEQGDLQKEAVRAIDAAWENRYNMMVRHRAEDYKWLEKQDPAVKQEFTYVYRAEDGTPKAYTSFRKEARDDGQDLVCSRFFFIDREGFFGLMGLFKSLSADHRLVKFSIPTATAMQYLAPEWSMGAATWSLRGAGMVRVVNVERVLRKAQYMGGGSAVLRIRDPQIQENDRAFAIRFSEGRAVSVEETQEAPDAVLSIPAFSALISGVCNFPDAAEWMDGIEICRRTNALSQVFYRKPMMIVDYF